MYRRLLIHYTTYLQAKEEEVSGTRENGSRKGPFIGYSSLPSVITGPGSFSALYW